MVTAIVSTWKKFRELGGVLVGMQCFFFGTAW